eukprot:748112-Hanusia_phi.AAC.5
MSPHSIAMWVHVKNSPMLVLLISDAQSSILGLLLKLSIDINLQDKHGRTPLHLAASLHTACASSLLVLTITIALRSLHSRLSTSASGNGKFKMVKLNRPPLPVVNFPLPVNKGKNLVDVEKEYLRACTWKKTDGIRPFPLEEQIKCCNLLVRAGADRKIEDEQGQKPVIATSHDGSSLTCLDDRSICVATRRKA